MRKLLLAVVAIVEVIVVVIVAVVKNIGKFRLSKRLWKDMIKESKYDILVSVYDKLIPVLSRVCTCGCEP